MTSPWQYIQLCLLLLPHLLCSGCTGLVPVPQIYHMWPSKSLYLDVPFSLPGPLFPLDILRVHSLTAFRISLSVPFHRACQDSYLRLQVLFHSKHYSVFLPLKNCFLIAFNTVWFFIIINFFIYLNFFLRPSMKHISHFI